MSNDHPTEVFRPVPGFPNHRVSNLGRVQRKKTPGRKWPEAGNFIWLDVKAFPAGEGYLAVNLCDRGRQVKRYIHRLVLEAFVGPCSPGMQARHVNCRDKTDNRLENLCWGTPLENMADCVRHGTRRTGERVYTAKITAADVLEMRRLRIAGVPRKELAARFGVNETNVTRAVLGTNWAELAPPDRERVKAAGYARGERHHLSKLSDADVAVVFEMSKAGLTATRIAKLFGVCKSTVYNILKGKTRKDAAAKVRGA